MESNNFYQLKQAEMLVVTKKGQIDQVKYLSHLYPELANCFDADTGHSPILFAAQGGHVEIVKFLLQKQVYVSRPSFQDEYPVFEAIKNGHEDVAILLINYGINFLMKDKEGYTILMRAASCGMERVVKLLIKEHSFVLHARCREGQNALMKAYLGGYLDVAELLRNAGLTLENPAKIKRKSSLLTENLNKILNQKGLKKQEQLDLGLRFAVRNQMKLLISKLIDLGANPNCTYDDYQKPLFFCAYHGNLESFNELYSHKARLDGKNAEGKTVLHMAIFFQNIPLLEKLMELEKEKFSLSNMKVLSAKDTLNPLLLAIIYERTKVLDHFFTKMQSDVLDKINAECPILDYAVRAGRYKSVETLLERKIDVNQKNAKGETPLILLAKLPIDLDKAENQSTLIKMANLLIQKGANVQAVSGGKSALDFAHETNKGKLAKLLTEKMSSNIKKVAPLIFSDFSQDSPPKFSDHVGRRHIKPQNVPAKFR